MEKSRLLLPDGTVLTSGEGQSIAIQSVTHTAMVNAYEELTCGSVCAAEVQAVLLDPEGALTLTAGEEAAYYAGDTLVGRFVMEKPERTGLHTWRVTGYDRVTLLDKDLTDWLSGLTGWPYEALTFARMVAKACGLALKNTTLLNGEYLIERFTARSITGRRLMEWLGQLSGSFCRATAEGELEFAWYEDRFDLTVAAARWQTPGSGYSVSFSDGNLTLQSAALTASGEGNVTVTGLVVVSDDGSGGLKLAVDDGARTCIPYAMGSLTLADYATEAITGIRLQLTDSDTGVTYPADASGNLYIITGNFLLTGEGLEAVAEGLYRKLGGISYTPCTVTVAADSGLKAGDRVTVRDKTGAEAAVYLMQSERRGNSITFRSTGSRSRVSAAAVNEESYKSVNSRLLEVRRSVEGLKVTAKSLETKVDQNMEETNERFSEVEMNANGLTATVSSVQQQVVQNQSTVNQQIGTVNNQINSVSDTAAQNARGLEQAKTDIATLQQSAEGVSIRVQSILDNGVSKVETAMGYTFDDEGLKIQKPGGEMRNTLDDTGMDVTRSGEVMLRADSSGVLATDVTVRNFLIVGDHARFENYSDGTDSKRTACFFI